MLIALNRGRKTSLLAPLFFVLATCDTTPPIADPTPRPSDPWPLGPGCDAQPDPHCNNTINRVLVPLLRGSSLPITDESRSELCRRMALDLVGRVPTMEENAQCANESAEQMADRYMAMPQYTRQQRRNWAERFNDLDEQWYHYIIEIDDLVERLHRDQISYSDFITQLIVHPGFYARFQGDDWSSNVIRYALGRNARADELAAMRPLVNVWDSRRFCDGIVWWNVWKDSNNTEEVARPNGACGRNEFAVNYCQCRNGDEGDSRCRATVFGATLDFGVEGCVDPENRGNTSNMLRLTDVGAGRPAVCPGSPHRSECADREIGEDGPTGQLRRLDGINGAQRDRLHTLGRALAARPDYWEAAVDRELRRFLDWWQAGLRKPDFDIPAVRTALADEFRRTGSLRRLQRTIVTSLLYAQRTELAPGETAAPTAPVWSFGPTRIMTAERWLDSAFYVTLGDPSGVCDFRFVSNSYDWRTLVNRGLVTPNIASDSLTRAYRDWAEALSGCSPSRARPVRSTLAIVSSQHDIALKLCSQLSQIEFPEATLDGFGVAVDRLYVRALGRRPSDEERSTAVQEMSACSGPTGECGANGGNVARWMCARLLDSAEFAVY